MTAPHVFRPPNLRSGRLFALALVVAASLAGLFTASSYAFTGPYAVKWQEPGDLKNHTVYRPTVNPPGEMPVLLWGEGACAANGLLYQEFLGEIASYGITVVASGGPFQLGVTSVSYMDQAIDWAKKSTERVGGSLYGKLDADHVAVAGHSCGGLEAYKLAARRPEVAAIGILNSGQIQQSQAQLDKLAAPILYLLGGRDDVAYLNGVRDFGKIPQTLPAFLGSINTGHFGTYFNKNGGQYASILKDWVKWRIQGDELAGQTFAGPSCVLCTRAGWVVKSRNL